jgi:uncharacterized membrane protein
MQRAEAGQARYGLTSLALALAGLGVSIYLSIEHYTASTLLACPESATINCAKVTASRWSEVGPVPVAVLGSVFFAVMALLCSPPAWRERRLDGARVAGAALGVLGALYFLWVELFRIDAICLWCTVVHVCALALLAAILSTRALRRDSMLS